MIFQFTFHFKIFLLCKPSTCTSACDFHTLMVKSSLKPSERRTLQKHFNFTFTYWNNLWAPYLDVFSSSKQDLSLSHSHTANPIHHSLWYSCVDQSVKEVYVKELISDLHVSMLAKYTSHTYIHTEHTYFHLYQFSSAVSWSALRQTDLKTSYEQVITSLSINTGAYCVTLMTLWKHTACYNVWPSQSEAIIFVSAQIPQTSVIAWPKA